MENFNKLIPIDGENGEKRTISSLQIAEITGKAYCGVLKVIRKMDIMRVKITMKNIFSLFVCLKKCCTFAVLQVDRIIYLAEQAVKLLISYMGFFYALIGYWRLPLRKIIVFALVANAPSVNSVKCNRFLFDKVATYNFL